MSAVAPQAPPRPRTSRPASPAAPSERATGARLRLAPAPASRHRGLFVVGVVSILAAGLTALLLLHTWAAQDGFTLAKLKRQQASLEATRTALLGTQQQLDSPGHLATAARALGMQPMSDPHFVTLRNGRVVARGTAAPPPAPTATSAGPDSGQGHRSRQRASHQAGSRHSATGPASSSHAGHNATHHAASGTASDQADRATRTGTDGPTTGARTHQAGNRRDTAGAGATRRQRHHHHHHNGGGTG